MRRTALNRPADRQACRKRFLVNSVDSARGMRHAETFCNWMITQVDSLSRHRTPVPVVSIVNA